MTPLKSLIVAGVLLLPAVAIADTTIFRCHAPHQVRALGPSGGATTPPTELRITVFFFTNGDLEHAAVIRRLTWRDAFGVVRHDSGPNSPTATPHPLVFGVNITTVPPGGTFVFATTTLWGLNDPPFVPPTPAGTFLSNGSMTVEVSSENPRLFVVHARETVRQRITDPVTAPVSFGEERSSQLARCFRIRDRDNG
jgi:hypothetical protein